MLTRIKVKVKLQHTGNCGDKISTILFKQRACRRENTPAVDTNSTPWWGENEWLNWAKQICSSREKNTSLHPSPLLSSPLLSSPLLSVFLLVFSYTCFYLWTPKRYCKNAARGRSGSSDTTMNCGLCLREAWGSVKMFCLCVCTSLWRKSKEMNAHSVHVCYGKIIRISSPCWLRRCFSIQKNSVCADWDRSYYSHPLIMFHFISLHRCFSVSISVSGSEWAHESVRGGERRDSGGSWEMFTDNTQDILYKKKKICKKSG